MLDPLSHEWKDKWWEMSIFGFEWFIVILIIKNDGDDDGNHHQINNNTIITILSIPFITPPFASDSLSKP